MVEDTEGREFRVASAEDVILNKLKLFRDGQEVSNRQWKDVLGVLRVREGAMDLAYMREWATSLGVGDLLERALEEAWASY